MLTTRVELLTTGIEPLTNFTHEPRALTMKFVRAQKKVSKGRPNKLPKPCRVVTDPQV